MPASDASATAQGSAPHRWLDSVVARSLLSAVALAFLLACLGFLFHGKTGVEKTLTKLVMPLGGSWLLLSGWLLQNLLRGYFKDSLLPLAVWLLITLSSCGPISLLATRYLENQVQTPDLSASQPLDAIVVLGGGTNEGRTRAQASSAGDRVLYAAQLYHQGLARKLITTGESIRNIFGDDLPNPSEQTTEIWTRLGIPETDIDTLPGINTFKEIEALAGAFRGELAGKRVGLLTSATHLPRAMRLAKAQGLSELVPLPADFRGVRLQYKFDDFLPGADALAQLARVQHELMAKLVRR
ncbi:MAG: YdcF family protein [bacterium]|nr:YdcF family protein [bacterium]